MERRKGRYRKSLLLPVTEPDLGGTLMLRCNYASGLSLG